MTWALYRHEEEPVQYSRCVGHRFVATMGTQVELMIEGGYLLTWHEQLKNDAALKLFSQHTNIIAMDRKVI